MSAAADSGPQTGEQVLKMVIKIGEMGCLFCDSPICFIDGDMVNFQTHLEYEHEVKVASTMRNF